jgi:hypothetical protein
VILDAIPEFDRILARFDAWYRADVADRPPVTVLHLWRRGAQAVMPHPPADPAAHWLDAEYRIECFEAQLPCRVFVGESFPVFGTGIAADQVATLFGGEIEFGATSNWAKHNLASIRDVLQCTPDFTHPLWTAIRRATDLSLERSRGRWLTQMTHTAPDADVLVALRGPAQLCLDLVDDPDGVRLAMEHVAGFFPAAYRDIHDRIAGRGMPTTFEGEVTLGRAARLGSDFLSLISPAMAAAAFYPALRRQIDWLERCHFHVDSAGWLPHLDMLLEHPKLCGIQWVYGANRGPAGRWIEVYRRIQAAGKAIELLPVSVQDALDVMRHLKPEGVWIKFFGGVSEEDARHLVAAVARRGNWA